MTNTFNTLWPYTLRSGHSDDPSQGACAMDAVNWLAHGEHGDKPECACPIIGAYVIRGNDAMDHADRQKLLPYLHRIAGSRSAEHEAARLRILVLGAARIFTPLALVSEGYHEHAAKLRSLPDDASYADIAKAAGAARAAAGAAGAAWAAARVARAAAEAAAGAAARVARVAAAGVAEARVAAEAAAGAAGVAEAAAAGVAAAGVAEAEAAAAGVAAGAAARVARGAAAGVARAAWAAYFTVLDAALNAGPQGQPWSADVVDDAVSLYNKASGRKESVLHV
jgi:hypothetical protein